MKYFEYLKKILRYPLEGEVFNGLFKTICKQFDNLKEDVYYTRNQYIPYISDNILKYADERGLIRFKYESLEQFKSRILYAFLFNKKVSTRKGIESLIKLLIKKNFIIRQSNKWRLGRSLLDIDTYLNLPNRFTVEFYEKLTNEEKEYIYSILRYYLPAHIDIYILEPHDEIIRWKLGYSILGKNTILKEE